MNKEQVIQLAKFIVGQYEALGLIGKIDFSVQLNKESTRITEVSFEDLCSHLELPAQLDNINLYCRDQDRKLVLSVQFDSKRNYISLRGDSVTLVNGLESIIKWFITNNFERKPRVSKFALNSMSGFIAILAIGFAIFPFIIKVINKENTYSWMSFVAIGLFAIEYSIKRMKNFILEIKPLRESWLKRFQVEISTLIGVISILLALVSILLKKN